VSKDILIKNVRLVDEAGTRRGDLYIQCGVIQSIGERLDIKDVPVIQGGGRTLLPSFIDLHAHFRDPGYPDKEEIRSGSMAAAKGGYTAVSLMANTDPVCDQPEIARYIRKKAEEAGLVEVFPVGAITRGLRGEELSDMDGLAPHVWAFSDDGMGVQSPEVMLRACRKAASLSRPLFPHCEYRNIPDRGLSEELMISRDLLLSSYTGCRLHIAHVSTVGAVEMITEAKSKGAKVTCEVTPHHLCLDRELEYTVNPALADRATRESLVNALAEGRIDAVATDHAPHTQKDKEEGAPGISGIETAFSLLYTRLVETRKLHLSALARCMSANPARILGLPKGELRVGYDGDVVLIEEDESFTVTKGSFYSKGTNSPLLGTVLQGRVWATLHKGEVIYIDGKVKGRDFDDHRQVL
jgi:dihydroorotase